MTASKALFVVPGIVALVALGSPSANADRAARTAVPCPVALNDYLAVKKPEVKKVCYDPFKDRPGMPAEVKITVEITYDASGKVASTALTHDGGQRGIAECVTARLRNWTPPCGPADKYPVSFDFAK
jgi:hypothetical protein